MPESGSPDSRPYGRRAFLGIVGVGLSSFLWGAAAWHKASGIAQPVGDLLPGSLKLLPSLSSGWRIYNVNSPMPTFDPSTWRLRIEGLVERPVTLGYNDLLALPRAEQVSDFHCVTGWSVQSVRWTGVRFGDLFAAARPLSSARAVEFVSAEQPYVDTLTLEQALLPDAMLGYEMDGLPLSRPHGGPARVVIPEMYGYKNVKWVERIVLTDQPFDGYWEKRGYDRDAWVGRSNGHG